MTMASNPIAVHDGWNVCRHRMPRVGDEKVGHGHESTLFYSYLPAHFSTASSQLGSSLIMYMYDIGNFLQ